MNGLTMAELFCGAGIGAVGFKQAGYDIKYAIDNNPYAVKTYNQNIGNHAVVGDVKTLRGDELPDVDVIAGGFPCTSFSVGGAGRGKDDETLGNLGYHFFRLILEKMPKGFIAENVEGLTTEKHLPFLHELVGFISSNGYNVQFKVLDCHHYGTAQNRRRLFIVGIRKDLNKEYQFPEPLKVSERKVMKDVLWDIQSLDTDIPNHHYLVSGFSPRILAQNFQRQWNEPSYTICSSARALPLHPFPVYDVRKHTKEEVHEAEKNGDIRRFTVRECLRLQSVPDDFVFPYDDSYTEKSLINRQYERCSGIPPVISKALSEQLANIIKGEVKAQNVQKKLF